MTIKSALSAIALSAGLIATPAFAQGMMIGTQTVAETDVEAVAARCADLQLAAETESLSSTGTDNDDDTADDSVAGNAAINNVPATDSETATSVDLGIITLAECEADGWFDM
ncbi:MAG: hypothetical protein RLW68_07270 [Devosia marina]|uniref:Uncharacterized protein n=1 Tax=Devosia marina TaxID=2683198 RepID=A0A7X3K3A9_9HYPH|nr:hypothetical protein [Devosia marina]MVS98765.1 hypothetical protein [Devosia marina]